MTDEQVAKLLREAYDQKPAAWIPVSDDTQHTRFMPRVEAHWLDVVRRTRDRLEANKREATAATILAALIGNGVGISGAGQAECELAVRLADAMRAELQRKERP